MKQKKAKAAARNRKKSPGSGAAKAPQKKSVKKSNQSHSAGRVLVATQSRLKLVESQVSHYRSALGRALYDKRKVESKMNETQKKALKACEAAALAMAAAIAALAESSPEAAAAPAPEEKKKPGPKPKAEEPKTETTQKPAAPEPPKEKSIMDKVRDACKEYAGINGREALRELLNKYTDKTVADIPADKLPEFLKDLGG